ncbi:MAG TPA: hypothetical protein VHO24_04210 [Opitutaceae bacterium]|nr:hypothetical protein [Opitutaceae bacterium]
MRWSNLSLLLVCLILAPAGFFLGRLSPAREKIAPGNPKAAQKTAAVSQSETPRPAAASEAGHSPVPSWDSRWSEAWGGANTPARNRKLAALLTELAKTNPEQALALARAVDDWRLRDILRDAALRGWASVNANAAGDWALGVQEDHRRAAVEAVMQGAATNPDAAVRVALRLCASDPERGGDYGHYTIAALVEAGAFENAVRFGREIGADKYPFLVKSAFFQWARNEPSQALAALDDISDPIIRGKAYGEVIGGWSWSDPKGLAAYALTLPAGSGRAEAIAEALPRWVEKDPNAAMDWMRQHDSGWEFDAGVAAIANLQSVITQQPATAMAMAGDLISDAATRTQTMRAVFRQWAENDPAAARKFLEKTPEGPDRATLLDELHDLLPDGG